MRLILLLLVSLFLNANIQASDFGDHDCNIFISSAQNVITGGNGNFLSAKVVVKKDLLNKYFQNYQVRIINYTHPSSEDFVPTEVVDNGNSVIFVFDKYTKGIDYSRNGASVEAYISNGVDRLYDNNHEVDLTQSSNWMYFNQACR